MFLFNCDLMTFTPAEAERITGVSVVQQRDWRRRGFLSSHRGHARFDAVRLAELLALKLLAERIGPMAATELATLCARAIFWHALDYQGAYDGDYLIALEGTPATDAEIAAAAMQLKATPSEDALSAFQRADAGWAERANRLRSAAWHVAELPRVVPAQFFIWWPTGEEFWHASLDAAFNNLDCADAKLFGPAVVMDQAALGRALVERSGGALVRVETAATE